MTVCQKCGHSNDSGAAFCANCRTFLEWSRGDDAPEFEPTAVEPIPPVVVTPVPAVPTTPCPACRGPVPAGRRFCPNCMIELATYDPAAAVAPVVRRAGPTIRPRRSGVAVPRSMPVIAAAGFIGIVALVLIAPRLLSGGGPQTRSPAAPATSLPTSPPTDKPAVLVTQNPSEAPRNAGPAPPGSEIYTVQSGDVFSIIANKFGWTSAELEKFNPHIPDPDLIRPGDEIIIPPR
jgi:LysM repeat protein